VSRCAVLATRNTEFFADRVFDARSVRQMRASLQPMAAPWLAARALAEQRGLRLLTADRLDGLDARDLQLVAYDWTLQAQALARRGASPSVLVSFEPPVIAWWLYANLPRISRLFRHVFLFEGARRRVAPGAAFHRLCFPLTCPTTPPSSQPWSTRRFLVMVNSNKALPKITHLARWFDRPREVSLKRALASLRYPPIAADRYLERWRAIDFFAARPDFDLFGEGFRERRHPAVSPRLHARALQAYRGQPADKLALMGGYKFALAIENTRFPGYVSEKLFDCLFAGSIPVYAGAPDVGRYVPPQAFIDLSRFASYAELERFLRDLSARDADDYLAAGQDFLRSPAFEPFRADTFARELVDALE